MDPGISHRDMPGYFFVLTVYTVIFILSLCVAGMMVIMEMISIFFE